MEDTPYNRKVLEKLKEIQNHYLIHQNMTGKSVLDSDKVPLVAPNVNYEASGFLSNALSAIGLGKSEMKKRVGRPRKGGKKQMEGSGVLSSALSLIGLGEGEAEMIGGKKKRGRPSKKQMEGSGVLSSALSLIGLGEGEAKMKKRVGRPKKGGNIKTAVGRPIGSGMDGAGFFDDLKSLALPVVKKMGSQALRNLAETYDPQQPQRRRQRGRPRRKAGSVGVDTQAMQPNLLTGNGIFSDILDGVSKAAKTTGDVLSIAKMIKGKGMDGGKKGTSKWIQHCKAYAKKHKMTFKDAMKSADCKKSYKK